MDIQIQNQAKSFSVSDYTIREAPDRESKSRKAVPHFQAKIHREQRSKLRHVKCLLNYYSQGGEFLGLDEAYGYHESGLSSEINSSLTIPPETAKIVCEVREEIETKDFYYWAGRIAVSLGIGLLVLWAGSRLF